MHSRTEPLDTRVGAMYDGSGAKTTTQLTSDVQNSTIVYRAAQLTALGPHQAHRKVRYSIASMIVQFVVALP